MPNGRSSAVRSHRRGGARRRVIAPWFAITLVVILAGSGIATGLVWVAKNACSGSVQATLVAAPGTADLLRSLATTWQADGPAVDGSCVSVQVLDQDTVVTAEQLAQERWNPAVAGPAPDVWVPQSSAWARRTAARSEFADQLMPELLPSVARSPVVIAMPKELATTFGWPEPKLLWKDLLDQLAADPNIKIGMSDPRTSTAGLLALSAIIDADDSSEVDTDELKRLVALEKRIGVHRADTAELFDEYVRSKGENLAVFPALERDVVQHNAAHPELPLVALYPNNATAEADHPYLVLERASWTTPERIGAAKAFLDYVRRDGRTMLMAEGFRDSNRVPGPRLTPANGVIDTLSTLPRELMLADSIVTAEQHWTALTRSTNVLLLLDISGSMRKEVPGTGKTRLDLTRSAAKDAITMFTDSTRVGLWTFATRLDSKTPYQELVPIGKLDEPINAVQRRDQLNVVLDGLSGRNSAGMYDSIWAAHQAVQKAYLPDADNMVVLLTDGGAGDQSKLSLQELVANLEGADPAKPVKVITIALGRDIDSVELAQISAATGVNGTYSSKRAYDIQAVLVQAIFNG